MKAAAGATLALLVALASPGTADAAGEQPETGQADALDAALGWLAEQPPSDAALEAAAAAGLDTARWPPGRALYGAVAVPANGGDAAGPLREILAVALAGHDPRRYPDPARGQVDLAAQLAANGPAALAARSDAAQAFQVLALAATGAGPSDPLVAALAESLAAKQAPDGGWGCGAAESSPDCTGFAVAALKAAGRPPPAAPVLGYLEEAANPDGGWPLVANGTSSTQSTAWAIAAYRGLGLEPSAAAWTFLLAQQMEDGGFACWADRAPCARVLATSEAVVALAGSHPLDVVPRNAVVGSGPSGSPAPALLLVGLAAAMAFWSRAPR